jgi:hypothetical protein
MQPVRRPVVREQITLLSGSANGYGCFNSFLAFKTYYYQN